MSSIFSLPGELYKMISENLDYKDAWGLKQTSRHFARVIEIPTFRSFQSHLERSFHIKDPKRSKQAIAIQIRSLKILIKVGFFPENEATCKICCRIASLRCFDEDQQFTRIEEQDFEAMMDMFCLACGADNDLYKPGDSIPYCSRPGLQPPWDELYLCNELTLCFSCLRFIRLEGFENFDGTEWFGPCEFCKACESCVRRSNAILNSGLAKRNSSLPCQHVETLGTLPNRARQQSTVRGFFKFPEQLLWRFYDSLDYSSSWALAQTCHFFYSSMDVTTIRKYFKESPRLSLRQSKNLATLRDSGTIPLDAQPCIYCKYFRLPTPGNFYYWKPLAFVDADSKYHILNERFCWCSNCSYNHGSTNGCPETQDIYTPCPDCMCCAKCMNLVERVLELEEHKKTDLQNGNRGTCGYCESALDEEERMERLKRDGCERYKRSSTNVRSILRGKESSEKEMVKERKELLEKERAERVEKEALRSGQWPEGPRNRLCYHPEVLHILLKTPLRPEVDVSGMA